MSRSSDHVTIHTKKYYRVVLEGIEAAVETPESFTVKLATRLHVSYPRAKLVVSHLPFVAKSGVSAAQANRLKAILEEIGGRARIEAHLVTPKDPGETVERIEPSLVEGHGRIVCPVCRCETKEGSTYCPFCHRRFRDPTSRPRSLEERIPEVNPLEFHEDVGPNRLLVLREYLRRYHVPILLVVIALLVVVFFTK